MSWNVGEAPRDGEIYVAMGRIVSVWEDGGESVPFLRQVAWASSPSFEGWLDEFGLSLSFDYRDSVHIDFWIPLPEGGAR